MTERQPLLTLSNDIKMPIIGYGVIRIMASETAELIKTAFTKGLRICNAT